MRSVNRTLAATGLALALAGCGNYSTEDLRFVAALPTRDDLRVQVPAPAASAGPGALGACGLGTADTWLWAKPTSDDLNAIVDWVLGLVDAVRTASPSRRAPDRREWGPIDDAKHPGVEIVVAIERTWPGGPDAPPQHDFVFGARAKGTSWWTPVLTGTFVGASARTGTGAVTLDFDALWAVGMNDPGTPHGKMPIRYDRASEPRTTELSLVQGGLGLVGFAYGYAGYADGGGAFDYAFRNAAGDVITVQAGFDAAGAGRAAVAYRTAGGATGGFRQCWDAAACLVYVDDPAGYSCAAPPCSGGAIADCPSVAAPPF